MLVAMFALAFALLSVSPAPNDTQFTTPKGKEYKVVGIVKEPHDPLIPNRILDTSGHNPAEVGWVWKATFQDYGVPVLNVCRAKDNTVWLFPPYRIWQYQKK
jgi:hypothetical protein